ncbi:hypothetical protein SAMN05443575_4163 [Jatrophihabitans endophyticus]|uniref:Lipoprotein n=1 Tax=Jatrophihabitans endophyticus TaxID=1206085 RepID=A0A1M5U7Y0_9ACTN|nr:hypothetical protein [Jatrophihabitans endophyticus]SHH59074.1 hypothetical protein SAMN05443575_4163 [Jatrophihabitans endophyticus]
MPTTTRTGPRLPFGIAASVAAVAVFVAACDGGSGKDAATTTPASAGSSVVSESPASSSSTPGRTTAPPRSSASGTGGASSPTTTPPTPLATGSWDKTYHPLPAGATVPRGSALRFLQMKYDVINGGWNLRGAFRHPGRGAGPIIYFALASASGRAGAATPFRLTTTDNLQVFLVGVRSPRPRSVVVFGATRDGGQGSRLLTVRIPGSAFAN